MTDGSDSPGTKLTHDDPESGASVATGTTIPATATTTGGGSIPPVMVPVSMTDDNHHMDRTGCTPNQDSTNGTLDLQQPRVVDGTFHTAATTASPTPTTTTATATTQQPPEADGDHENDNDDDDEDEDDLFGADEDEETTEATKIVTTDPSTTVVETNTTNTSTAVETAQPSAVAEVPSQDRSAIPIHPITDDSAPTASPVPKLAFPPHKHPTTGKNASSSLLANYPTANPAEFGLPLSVKIPRSVTPALLRQGKLLDTLKTLPANLINDALTEYDDAVEVKGQAIRSHGAYLYGVVKRYVSVQERATSEGTGILPMGEALTPLIHQRLDQLVANGFCTHDEMTDKVKSKIRMLSERDAIYALDELQSVDRSSIRNFGSYFMGILNRYMRGDHMSKTGAPHANSIPTMTATNPQPFTTSREPRMGTGSRDRLHRGDNTHRERSRDRLDDRYNSQHHQNQQQQLSHSFRSNPVTANTSSSVTTRMYDHRQQQQQQQPLMSHQQAQQPLSSYSNRPPPPPQRSVASIQSFPYTTNQPSPGMFGVAVTPQQQQQQQPPPQQQQQQPMYPMVGTGMYSQPNMPSSVVPMGTMQQQQQQHLSNSMNPMPHQQTYMTQQQQSSPYMPSQSYNLHQQPQQHQAYLPTGSLPNQPPQAGYGNYMAPHQQQQQQQMAPVASSTYAPMPTMTSSIAQPQAVDILGLADKAASVVQALTNSQQQQQQVSHQLHQQPYGMQSHQQQQQPLSSYQPQPTPYGNQGFVMGSPSMMPQQHLQQQQQPPPQQQHLQGQSYRNDMGRKSGRRTTASLNQLSSAVQYAVQVSSFSWIIWAFGGGCYCCFPLLLLPVRCSHLDYGVTFRNMDERVRLNCYRIFR